MLLYSYSRNGVIWMVEPRSISASTKNIFDPAKTNRDQRLENVMAYCFPYLVGHKDAFSSRRDKSWFICMPALQHRSTNQAVYEFKNFPIAVAAKWRTGHCACPDLCSTDISFLFTAIDLKCQNVWVIET